MSLTTIVLISLSIIPTCGFNERFMNEADLKQWGQADKSLFLKNNNTVAGWLTNHKPYYKFYCLKALPKIHYQLDEWLVI